MPKMRMIVTANVPSGITRERFAWYVQEWVSIGKGNLDPENDPLFDLDGNTVRVYDPLTKTIYEDKE